MKLSKIKLLQIIRTHWFALLFISLASLTMLNLLKWNFYSMWDLTIPPFSPLLQLNKALSVWDYSFLGGKFYVACWQLLIFLPAYLWQLFLPVNIASNLWSACLFAVAGLSIYAFFYKTVEFHKKNLQFPALIAALFYMFNPFWIFRLNSTFYTLYILAFLPLILLLTQRAIWLFNSDRLKSLKYILITTLLIVLMIPGLANLPVALVTFLFSGLYLLGVSILKSKLKNLCFVALIFLPLLLFTQIWWIYPNFSHKAVQEGLAREGRYLEDSLDGIKWWSDSEYISYYNILRNMAYYVRSPEKMSKSWGELWTPTTSIYRNNFFLVLSFLLPIFALSSLFFRQIRQQSPALILAAIILFFTPLFALLREPFGIIIKFIFLKIPFYILRRPPSYMFIFSFIYAYLGGLWIYIIREKINLLKTGLKKKSSYALLAIFLFLTIDVFAYPQWLGLSSYMNLKDKNGDIKYTSALVNPPDYAQQAVNFLNTNPDSGGVLILPRAGMLRGYDWPSGYFGWDYYYINLNRPVLSSSIDRYQMYYVYNYLANLISQPNERISPAEFSQILAKLNIKYILVAEDSLRHSDTPLFDLSKIKDYLSAQNNIVLIKKFGQLDLYENTLCPDFCRVFYLPNKTIDLPTKAVTQTIDYVFNIEPRPYILPASGTDSEKFNYKYDEERKQREYSLIRLKNKLGIDKYIKQISLEITADPGLSLELYLGDYEEDLPKPLYYKNPDGKEEKTMIPNGSKKKYTFELKDNQDIEYLSLYINILNPQQTGNYNFTAPRLTFTTIEKNDFQKVFNDYKQGLDLKTDYINKQIATDAPQTAANLQIQKISPTHYLISLKNNGQNNFILSSAITYHEGWQAEINGQKLEHLKINDLFNGWLVDSKKIASVNNVQINVYFDPQKKVDLVNKISLFSILTVAIILFLLIVNKSKYGQHKFFRHRWLWQKHPNRLAAKRAGKK